MLKSHLVFTISFDYSKSGFVKSSFLNKLFIESIWVWYLGAMCEGILKFQLFYCSQFNFPIISNSIFTVSKKLKVIKSLLEKSNMYDKMPKLKDRAEKIFIPNPRLSIKYS